MGRRPEPDRAPEPAPAGDEARDTSDEAGTPDAARQLIEALGAASNVVGNPDGPNRPELLDAARILLASFTWVSDVATSDTLDTHETNVLYRYREELIVNGRERLQLIRTMLTGEAVRPGWFWLAGAGLVAPAVTLAYLATRDGNTEVRRRALAALGDVSLLINLPEELSALEPEPFLRQVLDDGESSVRHAALELAAGYASDDAVDLLRGYQEVPNLRASAAVALARVLLQRDPDEALKMLAENRALVIELSDDAVEAAATRFGDEAVAALRISDFSLTRDLGLRIDIASDRLTEEAAQAALQDPDETVRGRALEAMLIRGWAVDDEAVEKILSDLLLPTERSHRLRLLHERTRGEDDLRLRANWYYPWSEYAYEALGLDHFETFGAQLRRDLDDDFEAFRAESLDGLRERFGEHGVEQLGHEVKHREASYLRAGLSALRERGDSEDADLARRYLGHSGRGVAFAAVSTLCSLGASGAAEEALRLASQENGSSDLRLEAARMAIDAAPEMAYALTASDAPAIAELAVRSLPDDEPAVERLRELLHAQADAVRDAAAKRLGTILPPDALNALLDEYTEGHYYYNVVAWFDRFLYCPEPFLSRYLTPNGEQ